jgi:membrane fusion protein (multidrug efflux system)
MPAERRRTHGRQLAAWLVVIMGIGGIAGGLGLYKYRQIEAGIAAAASFPEPVEAVDTVAARQGEWSATTRAIGTVVALRQVEMRNEIAGVVSEIGFASGEIVKAGQLLVKFDTRQEEAALAAAEAEARLAKLTLDRRESLRNSPAFSAQELDKAREEHAAATARASNLAVAIDKKRIVAPFDGRVGITNLQPGAYLDAGTRIVSLQGTDEDAFVDFSLPQDSATSIRTGMTVTLSNAAIPTGASGAEIIAEDDSADRTNRTVLFRAVARGVGRTFRPGMFIDVLAVTAPPRTAVLVPLTALRRSAQGNHVFVLAEEDGKLRARQRDVDIGPVQNGEIVIEKGLAAGELVAASGSFKLRDGLLVRRDVPQAASGQVTVR